MTTASERHRQYDGKVTLAGFAMIAQSRDGIRDQADRLRQRVIVDGFTGRFPGKLDIGEQRMPLADDFLGLLNGFFLLSACHR